MRLRETWRSARLCGKIQSNSDVKGRTMPRISPLHPDDAPVEAQAVLLEFFRARNSVPNMFRTYARRPGAMKTASDHMAALWNEETTADPKLKEMLSVRVSVLNDCRY
jgi:alkylhydroperoxidase family enzyme